VDKNSNRLIKTRDVKDLLGGVTDMTLWRWRKLETYKELEFPEPVVIKGQNYWWLNKVQKFIQQHST